MTTPLHEQVRVIEVSASAAGYRLDRFLALYFSKRSRTELVRGIRSGLVTLSGSRTLRASYTLREGDVLHIAIPGIAPSEAKPPFPQIIYEDDRVAVINKPAGLLAHPAGGDYAWAVIGLARDQWPNDRVDLVHRLDRETSGCMVLSKDLEANRELKLHFHDRQDTLKEYIALTLGVVPWHRRRLDGRLGAEGGPIRIRQAVREDGLHARTDVTVLARGTALSIVHCRLHTGRTHQIRVHLAHEGFPLLGDRIYALTLDEALRGLEEGWDDEHTARLKVDRQALHAWRLTFPHPDGHLLTVEAPVPESFHAWWHEHNPPA